jgi:hypothetical protein
MQAVLPPVPAPLNRDPEAGDEGWSRVMDLHRIEGAPEARYEIEAVAVDAPGRWLLVRRGLKDGGLVMAGGALG